MDMLDSIQFSTNNFTEQELVIERLRAQNNKRNAEYTVNDSLSEVVTLRITKRETQTWYLHQIGYFRRHPNIIDLTFHSISDSARLRLAGAFPFSVKHSFVDSHGIHYEVLSLPAPRSEGQRIHARFRYPHPPLEVYSPCKYRNMWPVAISVALLPVRTTSR